jgi:hypothetical protein
MSILLAIGLRYLKREDYHIEWPSHSMMTEKEIQILKNELLGKINSADNSYYGLSLENLVLKN